MHATHMNHPPQHGRGLSSPPPLLLRKRFRSGLILRFGARQPLAAAGILLLTGFVLVALFAPELAPFDPAHLARNARMLLPGSAQRFGTDELGRDILSRVLFGARISLLVAVSVVAISLTVGLVAGCLAGF